MDKKEYLLNLSKRIKESKVLEFFEFLSMPDKGIYSILSYLNEHEYEVVSGELAKELNVSTARVSTLLKKMEKRNLIKRTPSLKDARQTIVELTKKGKRVCEFLTVSLMKEIEYLKNEVGEETFELFIDISIRMNQALKNRERVFKKLNTIE